MFPCYVSTWEWRKGSFSISELQPRKIHLFTKHSKYWSRLRYCMCKKSWPILYSKLQYKWVKTSWRLGNIVVHSDSSYICRSFIGIMLFFPCSHLHLLYPPALWPGEVTYPLTYRNALLGSFPWVATTPSYFSSMKNIQQNMFLSWHTWTNQ